MLTLCPNLTVAQHVFVFEIALDKVLKVHWNIFGQFQQCSEVSEKIIGNVRNWHWDDFWKFLPVTKWKSHMFDSEKVARYRSNDRNTMWLVPSQGRCGGELAPPPPTPILAFGSPATPLICTLLVKCSASPARVGVSGFYSNNSIVVHLRKGLVSSRSPSNGASISINFLSQPFPE